jgi:hypothetical protein
VLPSSSTVRQPATQQHLATKPVLLPLSAVVVDLIKRPTPGYWLGQRKLDRFKAISHLMPFRGFAARKLLDAHPNRFPTCNRFGGGPQYAKYPDA